MNLITLLILMLGTARMIGIICHDKITEPIRHKIFMWSPPEDLAENEYQYQEWHRTTGTREYEQSMTAELRQPGFFGQLLSCGWCTGVWVAAANILAYLIFEQPVFWFNVALAVAFAGAYLEEKR